MAAPTTLLEEMVAAARGLVALVTGDRRAPSHFDFSQRGLAGSFIALLLAEILTAYGSLLLGSGPGPGDIARAIAMSAILFVAQVGCSALLLRQIGRLDGLGPYLVADNWATLFITTGSALLAVAGFTGSFAIIAIGILVLVIEVNIARLIVTLSGLQVAMFIVAQLVGVAIGMLIIGAVLPPDAATTLTSVQ